MKRSEINTIISEAINFLEKRQFAIPQWAAWETGEWKKHTHEITEIIDNMLGWDITDFGSGDFRRKGLIVLTLRNGNLHHQDTYRKPYAEKILITDENQITPTHFHWSKMEDIINRGGGNLIVELWNSTKDEGLSEEDVTVKIDGIPKTVKAGGSITLHPGESVTLEPGMYHRFFGEPGTGRILLGEVSSVNDDNTDNNFYNGLPRFPEIEEDEPPKYPMITEYRRMLF